ncbi:hypothetical protein AVEN_256409-1 [Araneus ventricosus]|uniref:Uncharacterized protein n=1 Tax=Araneus ventricosus TaxID=182803 RepID=A0A4Y2TRB2_ARAVE|nr:hypothetical protein AVEN_256409-1 [Araneus ventricosus]
MNKSSPLTSFCTCHRTISLSKMDWSIPHWIGCGGPVAWPPCSTNLDFFILGAHDTFGVRGHLDSLKDLERNRCCREQKINTIGIFERVRQCSFADVNCATLRLAATLSTCFCEFFL